jgi:hypothetical protein
MLHPTTLANGTSIDYGAGVRRGRLDGHTVWGHTGGNRSTWAILAHYPDDAMTIAVLVNTDGSPDDAWVLEGRIARAMLELGPPRLAERRITPAELSAYAGRYEDVRGGRQFDVGSRDGRLQVTTLNDSRPGTPLVHVGNHTFAFPDAPTDFLSFHMRNGRAEGYSLFFDGLYFNYRQRVDR